MAVLVTGTVPLTKSTIIEAGKSTNHSFQKNGFKAFTFHRGRGLNIIALLTDESYIYIQEEHKNVKIDW
jgi:creatinine amidohydrolase/Fe(II)-dependent formamide hydrolase-like protein